MAAADADRTRSGRRRRAALGRARAARSSASSAVGAARRPLRPTARVLVAWDEAAEAFTVAGVPPKRPETYREFATRAATATPVPHGTMRALADDASAAQFSGDPLPDEVADRAERTAAEIEATLDESTPLGRKILGSLDPRPLRQPRSKRECAKRNTPFGSSGPDLGARPWPGEVAAATRRA